MNTETTREKDRARATEITTALLTTRKLTNWEAGLCAGLRGHVPDDTQWQILTRLSVKYQINEAEQGKQNENTNQNEDARRA
jgi:hypothetical protein